jgi:hypothetical protein
MVYNSAAAKSMLNVCKNINAREIIQAVQAEQGAAAGPARTARRWVKDMAQDKSMIDPECAVEHDYHFLQAFGKAFETLNPGSIARIFTTEVNNEECFDGFCLCFKPQIVRIVRACIRAFTLDACFIKHEQKKLKGWALYTLCSIDSNGNLVCLAHCLYDKENQEGYDRLLGYSNGLNIALSPKKLRCSACISALLVFLDCDPC